jgi:site-specific DNA recombinase
MTKNVLFYARYSTERQTEQSIETQIDLGKKFVADHGWKLVEIYSDSASSGTNFHSRPGIQNLLSHVKRGGIDIVLCLSVDRLSRDVEHSSRILKDLSYHDCAIWTVQGGQATSHIELHIRSSLNHEMIEQGRYRTREGMRTATQKGKATTRLSYGYSLGQRRDANGDRIKGEREINPEQAAVIKEIYEAYASGVSPANIAADLNARNIPAPKGKYWRDDTIRGHGKRQTGILNNPLYIGKIVWNRQKYRKNPQSERRVSKLNEQSEWEQVSASELAIIDQDLWNRVKQRQLATLSNFEKINSNPLNRTHRPRYLLSGLLECAECAGSYSITGKGRYGCANHKAKLPIDELGGQCCSNNRTILRDELEARVLTCIPAAFYAKDLYQTAAFELARKAKQHKSTEPSERERLQAELTQTQREQSELIRHIQQRASEGRVRLVAYDDQLDALEEKREAIAKELAQLPDEQQATEHLNRLNAQLTAGNIEAKLTQMLYLLRSGTDGADTVKPAFVNIVRQLIDKVIIARCDETGDATLQVHGHLASILASLDATTLMEKYSETARNFEYLDYIYHEGKTASEEARERYYQLLSDRMEEFREDWEGIEVSVVAGAGFEPAAFRL